MFDAVVLDDIVGDLATVADTEVDGDLPNATSAGISVDSRGVPRPEVASQPVVAP